MFVCLFVYIHILFVCLMYYALGKFLSLCLLAFIYTRYTNFILLYHKYSKTYIFKMIFKSEKSVHRLIFILNTICEFGLSIGAYTLYFLNINTDPILVFKFRFKPIITYILIDFDQI